jgi:ArsR family transcriptional regulator
MNTRENARIFKALGNERRLNLLLHLLDGNCNVSDMAERMNIRQPTLSQHIAVLKSAGIIEGIRKDGGVCYRVISPFVLDLLQE